MKSTSNWLSTSSVALVGLWPAGENEEIGDLGFLHGVLEDIEAVEDIGEALLVGRD